MLARLLRRGERSNRSRSKSRSSPASARPSTGPARYQIPERLLSRSLVLGHLPQKDLKPCVSRTGTWPRGSRSGRRLTRNFANGRGKDSGGINVSAASEAAPPPYAVDERAWAPGGRDPAAEGQIPDLPGRRGVPEANPVSVLHPRVDAQANSRCCGHLRAGDARSSFIRSDLRYYRHATPALSWQ